MKFHSVGAQTIRVGAGFLLSCCMAVSTLPVRAEISQSPLLLGGGNVPGNLALVPSVEFPTVISVANLGDYSHESNYVGNFDSSKCYKYIEEGFTHPFFGYVSKEDGGGYFNPVRFARDCTRTGEWSGNYLNWATTQTIDPFRIALTGGYRVVDTMAVTILEKATRAGRGNYFPDRSINGSNVQKVSPFEGGALRTSVTSGSNYQMNKAVRVRHEKDGRETAHFYSVRVRVCVPGLLENNCVPYANGVWKPEGLIQQYARDIRFSVFSYLNHDGNSRNGGVLRVQQKYVGQMMRTPGVVAEQENAHAEWNPLTGILYVNPHNDDVGNSGVINYINKFGELTNKHKENDPVSELYYAALRYFRGQANLSEYSAITDAAQRDKFPVITEWTDPVQYSCQKNVILGIGDVNTHEDRDVPHSSDSLDVSSYTQKVFELEGIAKSATDVFSGRGNSAHIAGLAYYANTQDIRSDRSGKQTISTHWVDVREGQVLKEKAQNQYWLAAKYGGFVVPEAYRFGAELNDAWWWTNQERLTTGDKRPDNFYVASDAQNMIASLKKAFAQISNEVQSTTASLATNSTRIETDTAVYQSRLDSRHWSGDLLARRVNSDGTVSELPVWTAAGKLDAMDWEDRNILTIAPATASDTGETIATEGIEFTWSNLSEAQRLALRAAGEVDNVLAQQRLAYLRGDRSREISGEDRTLPFRQRGSRLADIVNSDPQFVYKQDYGYSRLGWGDNGAVGAAYTTFRASETYQTRTPLVVVGANGGMLHGFDASLPADGVTDTTGGQELFAYVPAGVFHNLVSLTNPDYIHRYYVDGTPRVADAWLGAQQGWRSLVVGGLGAGGRTVYALDVTNPASITTSNVLWEFSHPRMGYSMGQPALVALPNEKFGVIVTSGYHDSEPQDGRVWVLDAADGSIIREFTLPTTGNLGAPLASDTDLDMVADRLYVADTLGNLWRIDLRGTSPDRWDVPSGLTRGTTVNPLFVALDADGQRQAITAPLSSAFNDANEHMIFFGTGSFYRVGDNEIPENPKIDTFYGIIDRETPIQGRTGLLGQTILAEAQLDSGKMGRSVSKETLLSSHKGWYLDLAWTTGANATGAAGERVVAKATLRSGRIIFTTMTPSADPCAFGGTSWIMALDLKSGGRLPVSYFDSDGDGDSSDENLDTDGDGVGDTPTSGISDLDDGVAKGGASLFKWFCYAGSSGNTPECVPVQGSQRFGRQSWREVRN